MVNSVNPDKMLIQEQSDQGVHYLLMHISGIFTMNQAYLLFWWLYL